MFDAAKLLGTMLEHRSAPSAGNRLGNALGGGDTGGTGGSPLGQLLLQLGGGGSASGAGGGLGALLGGLGGSSRGGAGAAGGGLGGLLGALTGGAGGGGTGAGRPGAAGMMGGFADMLHRAANAPGQELGRNNPVAVGGLGALAGTLLGGGRGAVGGGLLAVLGSLAYSALQAGGQGGAAAAAAATHETPEEVQHSATLALKAMIQAAKADGNLDAREIERITGKLHEAGEDHEARDFVLREMRGPLDVEGLAAAVRNPKEAAEVYAASLMAIEVDTQAERDYLAHLAAALGLPRPTVDHIHQSLGVSA
jgi:uncharacterized membrane protein YebE (DUF533 family)